VSLGRSIGESESVGLREGWTAWRYRWLPEKAIGEILTKRWVDNFVPTLCLIVVIAVFGTLIPEFFGKAALNNSMRQLGEFTFVVVAMMIVMLAGGIDLSVGSVFGLANFSALALLNVAEWPVLIVIPAVLLICGLVGLVNGILVGYLRLRAFVTTLVTMIVVLAVVESLSMRYGVEISASLVESPLWDFLAGGKVLGTPFSFVLLMIAGLGIHMILTRTGPGWRLSAVGGSRRAAHNAGLAVPRIVASSYVVSSMLVGVGGILYAARLGNAGSTAGQGMEALALTAALLGGNSLGGGRGSVAKAFVGTVVVMTISNGLVTLGAVQGLPSIIIGGILLFAVAVDIKWLKNRHKILVALHSDYDSLEVAG
jgi:ribose transport system permease protein